MDDDVDREVRFHATYSHDPSSSISSLQEAGQTLASSDPYDFSPYMDKVSYSCFDVPSISQCFNHKAPITMANNSPMEFLHQIFVKLGARYAIITNADGLCQSICVHSCSNF